MRLVLVGPTVPAHAATSSYTVTIDTTEYLRSASSLVQPKLHFTLIGVNGEVDHSGWMYPVRRAVVQVDVEDGKSPVLRFRDAELHVGEANLYGKRYLRIGGWAHNPEICGWNSFASRDSGILGAKLNGGMTTWLCDW